MRTQIFVAALMTTIIAGYVYAPDVIPGVVESISSSGDSMSSTEPGGAVSAAPTPGSGADAAASGVGASVEGARAGLNGGATPAARRERPAPQGYRERARSGQDRDEGQIKPTTPPASRSRGHKHKADAGQAERDENAALAGMGLVPVTGKPKAKSNERSPTAKKATLTQADLAMPMQDRWLRDLSGPTPRLQMGLERQGAACPTNQEGVCERPAAPKDISVAGVVVKTERLVKSPSRPVEGRVTTGNYVDQTPVIYLK